MRMAPWKNTTTDTHIGSIHEFMYVKDGKVVTEYEYEVKCRINGRIYRDAEPTEELARLRLLEYMNTLRES